MKNNIYRLPETSTQESLEERWSTVLKYGDKVLLSGYIYQGRGQDSNIAAIYTFTTKEQDVEAPIHLERIADRCFPDNGSAIAWCIQNCR